MRSIQTQSCILIFYSATLFSTLYHAQTTENKNTYTHIEPEYPSYVTSNYLGLCLRATRAMPAGTAVGTADMVPTNKPYIPDHPSVEYRHVGLMAFKNGIPRYGRIRGKWAFCNHSCDPNCLLTKTFLVVTRRAIAPHEELTTAYDAYINKLPWQTSWSFTCHCQAHTCKKSINSYRADIQHPANLQTPPQP